MKQLKNLGFVLAFVALVLVLVVIRTSNRNLFQNNSNTAIEASKNGANSISLDELKSKPAAFLLVNLNREDNSDALQVNNTVKIPFENLLDKNNLKILMESDLKIVLSSEDISTTSKAWVILNQLNFKNVYILQNNQDEEVLKYKFQPDTAMQLE